MCCVIFRSFFGFGVYLMAAKPWRWVRSICAKVHVHKITKPHVLFHTDVKDTLLKWSELLSSFGMRVNGDGLESLTFGCFVVLCDVTAALWLLFSKTQSFTWIKYYNGHVKPHECHLKVYFIYVYIYMSYSLQLFWALKSEPSQFCQPKYQI